MNKLIITCAITGAEVTKAQNPAVPYTIEECALEAYKAYEAGASVIHLHARHDDGIPTQSHERYALLIAAIREKCPDVIIQVSTGGALGMSRTERMEPLLLNPEMATLDCGTLNFGGDDIFVNTENDIIFFAEEMNKRQIAYELECFEKGHLDMVMRLYRKGIIKAPLRFSFVLGVNGGMTGEVRDLMFMKESIPDKASFSVAGIGRFEFTLAEIAIRNDGHVRVGLEDNLYLEKGVLAKSNAELVQRVVMIARKYNREIASPAEARAMLGMEK